MGKKEHFEALSIDVNSNTEKTEEFFLHELLAISLKAGRLIFFGTSYTLKSSLICRSDFVVSNHGKQKLLLRLLHLWFFLFSIIPFITERIALSPCCLVNWIKKGLHIVLVFCLLVGYYCLEIKGRRSDGGVIRIFRQCIVLQRKFRTMGLHFPSRAKLRAFGWTVLITTLFICIIRQYIFAMKLTPWYTRYARYFSRTISLGFWVPQPNTTSEEVFIILGLFGVVSDGILANYWFYCQVFHFFCILTMWMVFESLNRATSSGYFQIKQLPDVMELHFESIKLLKYVNQMISPLIFWSTVFNIVCMCFWTNYIAIDFSLKTHHIAALCFFIKTIVEIFLEADVNFKAHQISEWLEESCTNRERFPVMDPAKLIVFTSQVYSKDFTGFKGLNIFVVTPSLAIAILGIVVTYSVAVNQFCH